jgi:nucleotide-binding universal stress UspA family protein
MKLLAYTDGKPDSIRALHFAAALKMRLGAQLMVVTVRSGTHATEGPPPLGVEVSPADSHLLSQGLRILTNAVGILAESDLFASPAAVVIQDMPHGHMFPCETRTGERVLFYEIFGHFMEALNREIDQDEHNLLIVGPPRRTGLNRLLSSDVPRRLALDLHTSLLVVRGGGPDSRYLVCADGSPSSRRQFPLLRQMLPAIRRPVDILWVKNPGVEADQIREAEECLGNASRWLEGSEKLGALHRLEGEPTADVILDTAGSDSVVVLGASLRHDVYRRMVGSVPMEVLSRSDSSVLLAKLPPEDGSECFKEPFVQGSDSPAPDSDKTRVETD